MNLKGKSILIGVCGGIAVYKVCALVSSLRKQGADVCVAMTKSATEFVSPLTFETLSANRVIVDMFDKTRKWEVEHISLAQKTHLCVIAPCTADFAGKLAAGIADDFLSTTVMALTCPVLVAPAMNTNMLNSKAYRANEQILMQRGFRFIGTESGMLACGVNGDGRMAEPETIEREIMEVLYPRQDLANRTVLVTAGGTIERLDPVRYIGNNSSGKMGYAIARAAADRGASVIFVKARTAIEIKDERFEIIDVESTKDMYDRVMECHSRADIVIMAAAPCDFRPKAGSTQKIKSTAALTLELEKTEDIAAAVGKQKGNSKLVIFAAETQDLLSNAKAKQLKKNADLVVANDVTRDGAGFNSDTNIVTLINSDGVTELPLLSKAEVADKILDAII